MLSVENSPDPSCSCNLLGIKADERTSDKSSLPEADQQKPGDFSIRKYVFTSRSKDIGTSWPFALRLLQLCQKHGIKDPLPPFEPPDTVRAQSLENGVECDQRVTLEEGERETLTDVELPVKKNATFLALEDNNIKEKFAQPPDPLVLKSLGQAQFPLNLSNTKPAQGEELCILSKLVCFKEATGEGDITSTVTDHDVHIDANSSLTVRPPCLVAETNKSQYSCEPPESKRRLIIKLCGSTESSRTEEILTNTSSAVDPMSSKICPVCRIFSSSSNTTLNAHIDQCLADESTANGIVNKLSKPHKVKPRKMRSMVDICATAPQCTLEELERRNGIIRPVDCGSFSPNEKILAQSKGPRQGPTDFCDDPSDNAVYVDSSGTKIRILSRFNDALDPVARENVKSRKLMKDKSLPSSKKRHLGLINSESLKGKPQNKKFCSIKQFKSQILEAPDQKHQMENQEKEESLPQFRNPEDPVKVGGPPGTLRHWVCSKRTGLSGKSNDKTSLTRNPLDRSTSLIVDSSSAERSPTVKLSKWPKKCISFPRSKRGDNLLDPNSLKDRKRDHLDPPDRNIDLSTKGHLSADCSSSLKLAKTPGNHVSSPRSKRVEIDACTESQPIPFSPKSKKKSRLRRSVMFEESSPPREAKNHMEREVRPAFKKPRKDRYMGQIGNWVEELPSNEIQGYVSLSVDRLCRTRKLRRSNIITSSETVEDTKKASKEEKQTESTSERSLSNTHGPDLEKVDSQVGGSLDGPITYCFPFGTGLESATKEVTASGDVVNAFLAKKTVGNHIAENPMSEANLSANCSDLQSDSSPSLEEHILPLSESEMWVEHAESRSVYDQEKHIAYDSTGISSRTAEFDSSVEGGSLSEVEPVELGSEPGPSQELELCLPCFEEIGFEVLQKNSRITSTVPRSVQGQAMSEDQSPSPVSATSTNSSKVLARPISPPRIQNNLSASLSDSSAEQVDATDVGHSNLLLQSLSFGSTGKTTKIDRESLKITIPASNDFLKFSDSPCCCSKKESASRAYQGAQFLNQSMMASGSIPLKGKHMNPTTNNSKREVSNSYATCSSSQIDGMLESPMTSMSLKSSLDASRRFPSSDYSLSSPTTSLIHPQSSSSPVLRLMGKNLTVVNKDEDESAQLPRAPVISPSDHPNTKYLSLLGYSTCNLSRQENSSIHCESPEGSVIYNPDPANLSSNFSAGFSSSFRTHSQSKVNQTPKTLQEMQMGGFGVPASTHLSKGNSVSPNQQKRMDNKPNSSVEFAYNIERTVPHRQCSKPLAATQVASLTREVIIIDDSPGIEADPRVNNWPSGSLDHQLRFGGVFPPNTLNRCNSRKVKAFSRLPSQSPFSREPSSGLNPRYIMSSPRSSSTCTKQGGNSSEGSHVNPGSPFILSSAGYRNSNLLFSKPNVERK